VPRAALPLAPGALPGVARPDAGAFCLALRLALGLTLRLALCLALLRLALRLALGLTLCLALRLTLLCLALRLALGISLRLTLGLTLGLTFRLALLCLAPCLAFRLTLLCLSLFRITVGLALPLGAFALSGLLGLAVVLPRLLALGANAFEHFAIGLDLLLRGLPVRSFQRTVVDGGAQHLDALAQLFGVELGRLAGHGGIQRNLLGKGGGRRKTDLERRGAGHQQQGCGAEHDGA
jgi:hypothetical protein